MNELIELRKRVAELKDGEARCKQAEEERMQFEHRLQQAQKAESLSRMAGAIAHNFNNMLGAAIGNLEIALDEVSQGSELQTCISEAMKASHRAAEISRFMLTYLGQTTGKAEPVDPAEASREACALLAGSIPPNVHLKAELPSLGPPIKADGAHLTQILTSLIANAVEAIGEGEGEISLAVHAVPGIDVRESRFFPLGWKPKAKAYACFSVVATGCGMDSSTLDRIFDPFFRPSLPAVVWGFRWCRDWCGLMMEQSPYMVVRDRDQLSKFSSPYRGKKG